MNKKCLHCLVGETINDFTREHDIDVDYVIDAMAEVIGDLLGSADMDNQEWPLILARLNIAAFERARESQSLLSGDSPRGHA